MISTIGLVAVAGFAASEIVHLAKAILRLQRDTKRARKPGEAYVVKGVRFDGYKDGKLIEAKGAGYDSFLHRDGSFAAWFERGKDALLRQAQRQFRASAGVPVEWHVAESRFARALIEMFKVQKWSVRVVHTPRRP